MRFFLWVAAVIGAHQSLDQFIYCWVFPVSFHGFIDARLFATWSVLRFLDRPSTCQQPNNIEVRVLVKFCDGVSRGQRFVVLNIRQRALRDSDQFRQFERFQRQSFPPLPEP